VGYLLDTHILLWTAQDSPKLSAPWRVLLEAGKEQVYFSVANIWEIVIKSGLRRGDFRVDAERLRSAALFAGYDELPIRGAHVLAVNDLPGLHADPFDRILLAQAAVEQLQLLTVDRSVLAYGRPALEA
jgi:PIN domain nuclease of toxin-antitoxin system